MLSSSLQYTPLAALSRPIAGTIGNTIITTHPGSVKAVKEILSVLFRGGVIEHAVDLIKGGSGQRVHTLAAEGRSVVARAEIHNHNHGHDHHHHHHESHRASQPRSATAISHDPCAPGTFNAYSYALTMSLSPHFSFSSSSTITLPSNIPGKGSFFNSR